MSNREYSPVKRATYNITDDKLKAWFTDRLSDPDYEEMRRTGFVFWHGRRCFAVKWSPQAEDLLIKKHGFTIEEDDTPDDVEARVDRFTGYAQAAESGVSGASQYLESGRANTDRRYQNGVNALARNAEYAAHWNQRIEAAIRHAAFKERPDVIARRIEGLEAELRRFEASVTPHTDENGATIRHGTEVIVGPKGRGAHLIDESQLPELKAWADRWIAHIEDRLLYERANLAAAGGIQAQLASPESITFEVGGALKTNSWYAKPDQWLEITKVNPKSIEVFVPQSRFSKRLKVVRCEITDVASKMRVDAGQIPLLERAPAPEAKVQVKETNRHGERPELLGAFGSSSTFFDDRTKPVEKWFLITKVNSKTIEFLTVSTSHAITAPGVPPTPRRTFGTHKTDIRTAGRFISAAQVKAEHPELLKELADLEALRELRAANHAA